MVSGVRHYGRIIEELQTSDLLIAEVDCSGQVLKLWKEVIPVSAELKALMTCPSRIRRL